MQCTVFEPTHYRVTFQTFREYARQATAASVSNADLYPAVNEWTVMASDQWPESPAPRQMIYRSNGCVYMFIDHIGATPVSCWIALGPDAWDMPALNIGPDTINMGEAVVWAAAVTSVTDTAFLVTRMPQTSALAGGIYEWRHNRAESAWWCGAAQATIPPGKWGPVRVQGWADVLVDNGDAIEFIANCTDTEINNQWHRRWFALEIYPPRRAFRIVHGQQAAPTQFHVGYGVGLRETGWTDLAFWVAWLNVPWGGLTSWGA